MEQRTKNIVFGSFFANISTLNENIWKETNQENEWKELTALVCCMGNPVHQKNKNSVNKVFFLNILFAVWTCFFKKVLLDTLAKSRMQLFQKKIMSELEVGKINAYRVSPF